jgi:hypothetical protein
MVNGKNYSEQQKINRPASGINRTGFGGLLPRHEITHEKSYHNTEYRQFFGEGSKKENDVECDLERAEKQAGTQHARPFEQQRTR